MISCYLKPPFSVSCAQLQSSVERPCPGQNVTFTCTIPSLAHRWEVPSLGITPRSLTPSDLNGVSPDPPFQFAVIEVIPGTSITSTATVTATANLNGTNVFCRDGNLLLPDPQNATIVVIGEWSLNYTYRYILLLHSLEWILHEWVLPCYHELRTSEKQLIFFASILELASSAGMHLQHSTCRVSPLL